jgi:asparagine synthase (glutamine-hydrolysing)
MCGIAGIVRLDGSPLDPILLDRLTDALAHRGPDGRGAFCRGNAGIGHRRLSILDLSSAGSQPMVSEDGNIALSFNGEIYNFAVKRAMLESKGYRFRSKSDTEVLLKLYEEFGPACLAHLQGMFAFAVLDMKRHILFLARDRVGKKPIKYFRSGNTFAFASEWKALRALPECPREHDPEALYHYLTMMYLPSPMTGMRGVHKLPAAYALTLDLRTGKETVERYWSLTCREDHQKALPEWKTEVLGKLEDCVRLRMVADVPLGAFLSGGIDSAAVVALMARNTDMPVKTFSIGSDVAAYNELPDAERIAKAFGTDHHPIVVQPDIVSLLPELVATYEEPYADPSAIPTYLIARETRKVVTVALNGDGGDENFGGYLRYPILQFSSHWAKMPNMFHMAIRLGTQVFHRIARSTLSYRCRRFQESITLPWEQRYLQYISFFTEEEKRAILTPEFARGKPRTDVWFASQTVEARSRADSLLHRAMNMDLETYLAEDLLPKVDLGSMAHGLEARSPFLDHTLLECTSSMPSRYKVRGRATKWFMREVLLPGLLPSETLMRRKTGFRLPLDAWFRGPLKPFIEDRLLQPCPAFATLFDHAALERFLRAYHFSRTDYSDHLWSLLWLEEWLRQYGS